MSFLQYQKESPEFLNNYLKYKTYIAGRSKTTSDETYYDLRTFLRFVKLYLYDNDNLYTITKEDFFKIEIKDITTDDLAAITTSDLQKYVLFINNTLENEVVTRNRKIISVKKLYEYLDLNNYIRVYNPATNLEKATQPKRLPKYLNLDESKKLLSVSINSDSRNKIRNYAITCIFLNCSIRLSELTSINMTDLKIDNSEQTLRIHGKGNKERIIYLDEAVCEAINAYLEIRPKLGKDNVDYKALFLSTRNKRISNRTVEIIIKNELSEAIETDSEKYHTHSLRHTGATLLYNENDVDIFVLKKILGHESLEATQGYTHVSNKKLKEIMENFSISELIKRKELEKC